jgi:hypothetical protein
MFEFARPLPSRNANDLPGALLDDRRNRATRSEPQTQNLHPNAAAPIVNPQGGQS